MLLSHRLKESNMKRISQILESVSIYAETRINEFQQSLLDNVIRLHSIIAEHNLDIYGATDELAGGGIGGEFLRMLIYWSSPGKDGTPRLRYQRNGQLWWYSSHQEIANAISLGSDRGCSKRSSQAALKKLRDAGLIESRVWVRGKRGRTLHVRLVWDGDCGLLTAFLRFACGLPAVSLNNTSTNTNFRFT